MRNEFLCDKREMHPSRAIFVDLAEHTDNGWQVNSLHVPLCPLVSSMKKRLFTSSEQSMMTCIGPEVLFLMEEGGEGLFGEAVMEEDSNVVANCRALLSLFKSESAQTMKAGKSLLGPSFGIGVPTDGCLS